VAEEYEEYEGRDSPQAPPALLRRLLRGPLGIVGVKGRQELGTRPGNRIRRSKEEGDQPVGWHWSRLVLSCLVLYCLVLSCLVSSCLVLSCLVLSCLVLCSGSYQIVLAVSDSKARLDVPLGVHFSALVLRRPDARRSPNPPIKPRKRQARALAVEGLGTETSDSDFRTCCSREISTTASTKWPRSMRSMRGVILLRLLQPY
jgi:hypothetical protein